MYETPGLGFANTAEQELPGMAVHVDTGDANMRNSVAWEGARGV